MWQSFQDEYLPEKPTIELLTHDTATSKTETGDRAKVTAQLLVDGQHRTITGEGNGPNDALVHAVRQDLGVVIDVVDYHEHSASAGADATAVCYVEAVGPDRVKWSHRVVAVDG